MIDGLAVPGAVLVDDGEGRGADGVIPDAEGAADRVRERGLPRPHRGVKRHDAPLPDLHQEFFGDRIDPGQALDLQFMSHRLQR